MSSQISKLGTGQFSSLINSLCSHTHTHSHASSRQTGPTVCIGTTCLLRGPFHPALVLPQRLSLPLGKMEFKESKRKNEGHLSWFLFLGLVVSCWCNVKRLHWPHTWIYLHPESISITPIYQVFTEKNFRYIIQWVRNHLRASFSEKKEITSIHDKNIKLLEFFYYGTVVRQDPYMANLLG